jgi:prophage regulatory protein
MAKDPPTELRIIREAEVRHRTSLSHVTLYEMQKRGEFPPRRKLVGGRVGWFEHEINEWIRSRPVVAE